MSDMGTRQDVVPGRCRGDHSNLVAYALDESPRVPIVASTQHRPMLEAPGPTFAVRCLPMLIGSQAGWLLMNTMDVTMTWNGGSAASDIDIVTRTGEPHPLVTAHERGEGVIVWHTGYVFLTEPGWDLVARAPANWPKRGASGLDTRYDSGVDPALTTTTLVEVEVVWQFAEPNHPVTFAADEPFGMVVPTPRQVFDDRDLIRRPLATSDEIRVPLQTWIRSRAHFKREMTNPGSACRRESWQRDYFRGNRMDGSKFSDHQTKLRLREFEACPVATADVQE